MSSAFDSVIRPAGSAPSAVRAAFSTTILSEEWWSEPFPRPLDGRLRSSIVVRSRLRDDRRAFIETMFWNEDGRYLLPDLFSVKRNDRIGGPITVLQEGISYARQISTLTPAASKVAVAPHGRIAVLVPCHDEVLTIATVVERFRRSLPGATIYVYDNNSTDGTAEAAVAAGAVVRQERRQGKGNVVRRMFSDVDADCYVMVDGDDTYDSEAAVEAVNMVIAQGFDFVNVARVSTAVAAYRGGHRLGNVVLTQIVRSFFGRETSDMLSGYKVLSRRFVKSFPAMSGGFETETELTVHALEMRMAMGEVQAPYKERPEGSTSKLRTYRDGALILVLISRLIKDERPLAFFGILGLAVCASGCALSIPVLLTYLDTGLVPRLPTAVLSVGMILLGWLSIFTGLTLDVVTKARREIKRLTYLSIDHGAWS